MIFQTAELLHQLESTLKSQTLQIEALATLDENILQKRNTATSWTILECIEHLNLYSQFYIPELIKVTNKASISPSKEFQSGWLGNYFAESMLPNSKMRPMKTFKDKNPLGDTLSNEVIAIFLENQKKYEDIILKMKNIDLKKNRVKLSISKWISISIGDTLRFIINHQTRHLEQINKISKDK